MFFSTTLFSALLVAPVVLGVPFGLDTPIARRGDSFHSQPLSRVLSIVPNSGIQYSTNWAGAALSRDHGKFDSVTGTFTVPTPSGSFGAAAGMWIGLDGVTCKSVIFHTGINLFVERDGQPPVYTAWYQWYPANAVQLPTFNISAGDQIRLTIAAITANSGVAKIHNLSSGQVVENFVLSNSSLCLQDADWIVEDFLAVSFANFDKVTFTNAWAATEKQTYYPSDAATILDIVQNNNQVLTSVSTDGASVAIQYV